MNEIQEGRGPWAKGDEERRPPSATLRRQLGLEAAQAVSPQDRSDVWLPPSCPHPSFWVGRPGAEPRRVPFNPVLSFFQKLPKQ